MDRLNSAILADKVLRKPINVTNLTTVPYSFQNLSKGLSTSHLHLLSIFFCSRDQSFVTHNNHISDSEGSSLIQGLSGIKKTVGTVET